MKIIKGVFTYLLIMIGIVAIAGILLFTAMAFLHVEVFGLNVIMHNKVDGNIESLNTLNTVEFASSYRTIEINSNNYDVNIRANASTLSDSYVPYVEVFNGGFGLSTNGVTTPEVTVRYYSATATDKNDFITDKSAYKNAAKIVIDVNAPKGLISYKDSSISLRLPYYGVTRNSEGEVTATFDCHYNLVINSGEGDINIYPAQNPVSGKKESGNLSVKSLAITTTKGNVAVSGLKETDSVLELSSLELKTETGKFDFSAHNIRTTNANNVVKIEGVRGDFKFKKYTGKFAIKGENLVFEADVIDTKDGTFLYNCPNGTMRIGTLNVGNGVAQIVTEYARVEVTNVIGDTSIQATYGDTIITNTYSDVIDVTTTHGNITLNNVDYSKVVGKRTRITEVKNEIHEEEEYETLDIASLSEDRKEEIYHSLSAENRAKYFTVVEEDFTMYVYDYENLPTYKKALRVEESRSESVVALRSKYGDINVKNYVAKGWFTNVSGRIIVNQNATDNSQYETKIETEKGSVTATNILGYVTAKATGGANMEITFKKVVNVTLTSEITIGTGKLTLNVPTEIADTTYDYKVALKIQPGGHVNMYSGTTVDASYSADNEEHVEVIGDSNAKHTFNINVGGGKVDFVEYAYLNN